jgi:hypothetical protein
VAAGPEPSDEVRQPIFRGFREVAHGHRRAAASLVSRLVARPVLPQDAEIIYQPTQFLALMIKANGYDGLIHPSATGPGRNVVLFDPTTGEVQSVSYSRVRRVAYFWTRMSDYEDVDGPGSYDYALPDPKTSS